MLIPRRITQYWGPVVTQLPSDVWKLGGFDLEHGSNGTPFDLCGLITAESVHPPHGKIVLPHGYFHKKTEFVTSAPFPISGTPSIDEAQAICKQQCEDDKFCAVADLFYESNLDTPTHTISEWSCSIYHHSEALTVGYEEECDGNLTLDFDFTEVATQRLCAAKASGVTIPANWWFSRQPDECVLN